MISRWNHNIHFHRRVLQEIPPGARSALDVGTGDGLLAGELGLVLPDVTGIDIDAEVLARASAQQQGVTWVHGDVLEYDFGRTFDVVASVATMHHFSNPHEVLERLRFLTAPGGVLVVVGLARATTARDHLWSALGMAQHAWYSRTRGYWEHSAPTVWPPPHSYTEMREIASGALPGVRWRQFALWRYALVWHRPHD